MRCTTALSRHALLCAVVCAVLWPGESHAQRFRVCAFGFNNSEDLHVVRSHLPPDQFDFIDFSGELLAAENAHVARLAASAAGPQTREGGALTWVQSLCQTDLQCDVVFYSGEFAGGFFGRYGSDLRLEEMEELACQTRCDGLFHHAQEVFLLGCNTLATKDRDHRTPQEYREVLLSHGFDEAAAERIVELRYGPLGPSFRESIRRIFMAVPRIYGFTSVAPSAAREAPRLAQYFKAKGDYAQYLARAGGNAGRNQELLAAFRGTGLDQAAGMTAVDPQANNRDLICGLYDDTRAIALRLRTVRDLLARPDSLSFLPSIEVFFRRHPPERFDVDARRGFADIQTNRAARDKVTGLLHHLDASLLQLELAEFARQLAWITRDEFRGVAVGAARHLLMQPPTSDVVDRLCDITTRDHLGDAIWSDDLPEGVFHDAEGIRLVACLAPADERVSPRLVEALDNPDVWARRWAAYALAQRLPLDTASLNRLASHLHDPSTDVRDRLQWILQTQRYLPGTARNDLCPSAQQFATQMQR